MNIVRVGNANLVLDCRICENEAATPYTSITIIDEQTMAIPCSTLTCQRVTWVSRQRPNDDPDDWVWDHNRAMNFAFQTALRGGAAIAATLPVDARAALAAEGAGTPRKRFDHEELKIFRSDERVLSVAAERRAEEDAAAIAKALAG